MKKFTVPCLFFEKIKSPFTIYIGEPSEKNPLYFQAKWLQEARGGVIPVVVMESIAKLAVLARTNNVSFEELCAYALSAASKEREEGESKTEEKKSEHDQQADQKTAVESTPSLPAFVNSDMPARLLAELYAQAKHQYEEAKGQGYAAYRLALLYEHGYGVTKNEDLALAWFKTAAEHNDPRAQQHLVKIYLDGTRGEAKSLEKACDYTLKAAAAGEARACFNLAVDLDTNREARTLITETLLPAYLIAATQGNATAALIVGYLTQLYDDADVEKAKTFYEKAAQLGNPAGYYRLGLLCEHGIGQPANLTQAIRYYDLAAKRGQLYAAERLGDLDWSTIPMMSQSAGITLSAQTKAHLNHAQSAFYYEFAAQQGSAHAQAGLALCYMDGKGKSVDESKASQYAALHLAGIDRDIDTGALNSDLCTKLDIWHSTARRYEAARLIHTLIITQSTDFSSTVQGSLTELARFYHRGLGGLKADNQKALQLCDYLLERTKGDKPLAYTLYVKGEIYLDLAKQQPSYLAPAKELITQAAQRYLERIQTDTANDDTPAYYRIGHLIKKGYLNKTELAQLGITEDAQHYFTKATQTDFHGSGFARFYAQKAHRNLPADLRDAIVLVKKPDDRTEHKGDAKAAHLNNSFQQEAKRSSTLQDVALSLDVYHDEKSFTEALAAHRQFDETGLAHLVVGITEPALADPIWKIIEAYADQPLLLPLCLPLCRERLSNDEALKQRLWQVVEKSRTAGDVGIRAAAQAITLLNAGGENFSSKDLRGIRIPGADLSGALLQGAQLQEADLTGVNFQSAWLSEAKFNHALLHGIHFGEQPFIPVKESVNACQYSPDGRWLAVAAGHVIELYEAATRDWVKTFTGHNNMVNSVAWDAKGERLASGSIDKTIRIWEAASGRELRSLQGHTSTVNSIAWDAKGERLASGSADKTARIWEVTTGREVRSLQGHTSVVSSVAWDAKGEQLASGSADQTVRVWEVASGREVHNLRGHTESVTSVAWDMTNGYLASGSSDKTVRVWTIATGHELDCLRGHTGEVRNVVWDQKGKRLASASSDKTIRVWEVASGRELRCLQGHTNEVRSVVWDEKAERLASGSADQTVRIWELSHGRELRNRWGTPGSRALRSLQEHKEEMKSIAWDRSGERLASGSDDNTIRIWETTSGRELRRLQGHALWVSSVAWDTSGKRLVSGSEDKTVRIWDIASGKELFQWTLPETVYGVAFASQSGGAEEILDVAFGKAVGSFELIWQDGRYTTRLKALIVDGAALQVADVDLTDAQGLSADNAKFLKQRGAIGMPAEAKSLEMKADRIAESKLTHIRGLGAAAAQLGTFASRVAAPAKASAKEPAVELKISARLG